MAFAAWHVCSLEALLVELKVIDGVIEELLVKLRVNLGSSFEGENKVIISAIDKESE